MYYPEDLIEEIRIQNNIVDVVSEHVQLKKKGSSYFGLCPFHNEKTPSFSVSEEKQMYYCFGCGACGNVYTFVMEYENYTFLEAVKYLADRAHITLPTPELSEAVKRKIEYKQQLMEVNREAARYFYYQLYSERGNKALTYLDNRGITETLRKKFGLGYSNVYRNDLYQYLTKQNYSKQVIFDAGLTNKDKKQENTYHDRFWNRVMFPILDVHSHVIGFGGRVLGDGNPKYLNSPETKLFEKSRNLYALNIARTSRKSNILMVEGYMDVIALHQAGFNNAVASLGTALTGGHAKLLKRYTDEVIIAYDSDEAGINATLRAIPILEAEQLSVRVLHLGEYKDPDEFIQNNEPKAFEKLLETAEPSFIYQIQRLETNYRLKDPVHKTRFVNEIAKLLLRIESDIERDNFMETIIEKYSINQSSMKKLIADIGKNTGIISQKKNNQPKTKKKPSEDGLFLAQKTLLTLITDKKNLYTVIKDHLKPEEFTDDLCQRAASYIYNSYEQGQKIVPATLINHFTELAEQTKMASIFNHKVAYKHPLQLEKIVNESIKKIKLSNIEALSRSIEKTIELQKLILAKRELEHLHISLNDG